MIAPPFNCGHIASAVGVNVSSGSRTLFIGQPDTKQPRCRSRRAWIAVRDELDGSLIVAQGVSLSYWKPSAVSRLRRAPPPPQNLSITPPSHSPYPNIRLQSRPFRYSVCSNCV
ncbi:hypothetical protein J437_LFUL017849 [Ladona fulva]|uniref:Uncharacterized protein n=1 Tax=Ladona fulva TaxID=123851 RepID=A0A8K0KEG5_LADFU|nr:hypothetical protein J437_LFUL017849 [Ladona fulva]